MGLSSQKDAHHNYSQADEGIAARIGFEACLKFEIEAQSLGSCFDADAFSSAPDARSNACLVNRWRTAQSDRHGISGRCCRPQTTPISARSGTSVAFFSANNSLRLMADGGQGCSVRAGSGDENLRQ